MTEAMLKAAKALGQHGFTVHLAETAEEAAAEIAGSVSGKTVGMGGSVTLEQMGLFDLLSRNNTVYWHWKQTPGEARKLAAGAQVYCTSANAVSETGEIVNIDGTGNRIASMFFGHERLIIAAGRNKLAPTLEEAVFRARNTAAPLNARRLKRKTPCAAAEPMRCHDCSSPERICCAASVHARPAGGIGSTEIWLIDADLGY